MVSARISGQTSVHSHPSFAFVGHSTNDWQGQEHSDEQLKHWSVLVVHNTQTAEWLRSISRISSCMVLWCCAVCMYVLGTYSVTCGEANTAQHAPGVRQADYMKLLRDLCHDASNATGRGANTHANIPVRWPSLSLSTLPPGGEAVESSRAASLRAAELTSAMCMSMRDSMTGLWGLTGSTHLSEGSSPPQFASAHPWPSSHSPGAALSAIQHKVGQGGAPH